MRKLQIAIVATAWCLVVSGCGQRGPKMYPVTGTVAYKGEPLPLGMVMFVPKGVRPSKPSQIDNSGRYQLEAVAGEHSVGIIAIPEREGGRPNPRIEGGIDYTGVPEVKSLIPDKYNRHDTSGITVVVEPGKLNEIDIFLE